MSYGSEGRYGGILGGDPERVGLAPGLMGQYQVLDVSRPEPKRCPHCGKNPDEPPLELLPEGGFDWEERGGLFIRNSWREPFELALGPLIQADEGGGR